MEGKRLLKVGIVQTAFIGDVILSGLLVEGLFRAGHRIVFFTKSKTSAIFENDTRVSKVITLNKPRGFRKIFAFWGMVQQVRNENLDVLLCPHRSLTTTLLAFFSGVKLTVGYQNATLSFLYHVQRPYPLQKHECLRYLDLIPTDLCPAEITAEVAKIGRPVLNFRQLSPTPTQEKIRPYFVVAIGSAWNTKKYTHEHLSLICKEILDQNPTLDCYLTGDKNEAPECYEFETSLAQHSSRIRNVAGNSTLKEFVAIVANAQFIIANDSSPIHFAGAFNVPTICFFGPTVPEMGFGPSATRHLIVSHKTIFGSTLNCQPCGKHGAKQCPLKHHACMKKLTPDFIFPKIESFLKREIDFS